MAEAEVVGEEKLEQQREVGEVEEVAMSEAEVVGEEKLEQQREVGEGEEAASSEKKTNAPPPISSFSSLSLSIWPPSQRTRDAVVDQLVKTLTESSVLTKRYGSIPRDEASSAARKIEEEAFGIASDEVKEGGGGGEGVDDDGMVTLDVYSKQISKKMMILLRERNSAATADSAGGGGGEESAQASETSQA